MSGLDIANFGRALEILIVTPVNPARSQKGRPMWIYDGEEWTEEGANEKQPKPDSAPRLEEMYQPELQVIEVVPVPKNTNVPPLPMP